MIDVTNQHPFAACAAFAIQWLDRIAAYDLEGAEALIDGNESGADFASSFPRPDGFTYCPIDQIGSWTFHIVAADEAGLSCDFHLPFLEDEFRPMYARFNMKRNGDHLLVNFEGVTPS